MELNEVNAGLESPATLIPAILKGWTPIYDKQLYKDYDPASHKINDKTHRPDKPIYEADPEGGVDDSGNPKRRFVGTELVTRIALAIQEIIVTRAAAFATAGDTTLTAVTDNARMEDLLKLVKKAWDANKLRYENGPLFEAVASQREAAEIWYSQVKKDDAGKVISAKLKCRFYFPDDGWELIPVFDRSRDMVAFGLQWKDADSGKTFFDLYTADKLSKYTSGSETGWTEREEAVPLQYGKIPVIYYSVPKAAWETVQSLIERIEKLMSNYGDTNDYNGSPILGLFGSVKSMAKKGEAGKAIQFEDGADAKYITWEGKPEAIISEHDMLLRFIYSLTQTPDLSFEAMRGLGDLSGIAFKRLLIDAHLKAKKAQEGWYGKGIQRRLNFMVAAVREMTPALGNVDIDIYPKFSLFSIDDEREVIDNMLAANGNKPVISHKESVAGANLTDDPEATYQAILDEVAAAPAATNANALPGGNIVPLPATK